MAVSRWDPTTAGGGWHTGEEFTVATSRSGMLSTGFGGFDDPAPSWMMTASAGWRGHYSHGRGSIDDCGLVQGNLDRHGHAAGKLWNVGLWTM